MFKGAIEIQHGTCGKNLTWTINGDTLTVSGSGDMDDCQIFSDINVWPIEKVIVEHGVTSIGAFAFSFCSGLKMIDLPETVTKIGKSAFLFCERLSEIKIPTAVDEIADSTFCGCWGLKTIDLPENLTALGKNSFSNCTNLQTIQIPDGVNEIGDSAFKFCESLTEVKIPASVKVIGDGVFERCESLEKIICAGNVGFKEILTAGNGAQIITENDDTTSVDLTWRLNGDTLTIISTDSLNILVQDRNFPWYDNRAVIKKIIIKAQ